MKVHNRKFNLFSLADYSGLFASLLCFIHCWVFPLIIIILPGYVFDDDRIHPVIAAIALTSSLPMVFSKQFRSRGMKFRFALHFGNMIMLTNLLAHDHLGFAYELLLNSIGGISLMYVHYINLKKAQYSR